MIPLRKFLRLGCAGIAVALLASACSIRNAVLDDAADAFAAQGGAFAGEEDPELIRDAAPFSLKLVESLLAERPAHRGLLLAAARGFTQYAYAFVQQEADQVESRDVAEAFRLRRRAAGLYRRARDYGLRGLTTGHGDPLQALRKDGAASLLAGRGRDDVALLYWTGAAWAGWIALAKDDREALADWPLALALLERALTLDEGFGGGALHSLFISLEMSRAADPQLAQARARAHFARARELNGGRQAGPYVALAESVAIPAQDRAEFTRLLQAALALDPDADPPARLENHVLQKRARWLLDHADQYFLD